MEHLYGIPVFVNDAILPYNAPNKLLLTKPWHSKARSGYHPRVQKKWNKKFGTHKVEMFQANLPGVGLAFVMSSALQAKLLREYGKHSYEGSHQNRTEDCRTNAQIAVSAVPGMFKASWHERHPNA